MNYYKRHIGDYAAATRHLSVIEHGAYTLLLDVYYSSETPLPADIPAVLRLMGARTKEERAAGESVLREFFTLTNDGWRHSRCDEEIAKASAKAAANREAGKKGGRPRSKPKRFPEETQTVSENNPNGSCEVRGSKGTPLHHYSTTEEEEAFQGGRA